MKKLTVLLLMILAFNFSYSAKLKPDSLFVSSKEYQTLNEKINTIEKFNIEKSQSIDKVNSRICDLYTNLQIWVIAILSIIGVVLVANWFTCIGQARKQADKELKELKDKYDEINSLAKSLEMKLKKIEKLTETTN